MNAHTPESVMNELVLLKARVLALATQLRLTSERANQQQQSIAALTVRLEALESPMHRIDVDVVVN